MSELYIKQERFDMIPEIDALLFDVDGVILDTAESFNLAIVQTLQYYCEKVLLWEDNGLLLNLNEISLFKMAGNFNNDWDVTNAAAALAIAKHTQSGATDTKSLREQSPSWQEFTAELKHTGGGFPDAEAYILEMLTPKQRRNYAAIFNPKLVTQIFKEIYGGAKCEELYGFQPEYWTEEGLLENEKVLLDKDLIPSKIKVGLITGRTLNEARLAVRMAKLHVKEEYWVTEDHDVRKPDGRAIHQLEDKLSFQCAVFIGDTMDDLNVVKNYRALEGIAHAKVLSCIVLPEGEQHRHAFLEAGADIVASDANQFLEYFKQVRHAKQRNK